MTRSPQDTARTLAEHVSGRVLWERGDVGRYAGDFSIYRVPPLCVLLPRDVDDVVAAIRFAREEGLPVTARGGGSNTGGSALGRGIVLAFDRDGPLNRIVGCQERGDGLCATVEPGLLHDRLQAFLRERGCFLPADPSSGAMSVLGGNIATKASGPHALKHGAIDRYLLDVEYVAADGEVVDTAREETIPAALASGIRKLRDAVRGDDGSKAWLQRRRGMKTASGYNMCPMLDESRVGTLIAQSLVGSVGTLGIVTRATLRSEPLVEGRATSLLYFRRLADAGAATAFIRELGVAAIEVMDYRTIRIVTRRRRGLDVPAGEHHMLLVEYVGSERHAQIEAVARHVRSAGYGMAAPMQTVEGAEQQDALWRVRKAILPVLRSYDPHMQALSVVNDVGVPVSRLPEFIERVQALFGRLGLEAPIYGHAGSGNLHLRPLFDVRDPALPETVRRVAEEVYGLVTELGGTITAEHGMGRLRAPFLELEWPPRLLGFMRGLKGLFDPEGMLNPGVMFAEGTVTDDMAGTEAQRHIGT